MQRVDDVTGEPIQLSATQRERWRQETERLVHELVHANNQLYAVQNVLMERVKELEDWRSEFALEIKPAIWRELGLLDDKIVTLHTLSLFERLRWLVLGR